MKVDQPGAARVEMDEPEDRGPSRVSSIDIQPDDGGFIVRVSRQSTSTRNGIDYLPPTNKVFADIAALTAYLNGELG